MRNMGKKISILGAGLSGMIAAIDLAKHGYEVTVIEKAEGIGGIGAFHPSVHATPINIEKTVQYTGIDISDCFHPVRNFRAYFGKKCYHLEPDHLYSVERSGRESSVDAFLYGIALERGVNFQFGSGINDHRQLPEGSIIATGLYPALYDSLHLPKSPFFGVAPKADSERENELVAVFDDTIGDYYYHGTVNGILFGHLFQRKKLARHSISRFRNFLTQQEEFPNSEWIETSLVMPGWSVKGPRLFSEGKILAGTISGMIDPLMGFGIVAAMYSGKIASMAVCSPEMAEREFRFFTRNWHVNYVSRKLMDLAFFRTRLQEFSLVKAPEFIRHLFLRASKLTIPGVDIYPMMKPVSDI